MNNNKAPKAPSPLLIVLMTGGSAAAPLLFGEHFGVTAQDDPIAAALGFAVIGLIIGLLSYGFLICKYKIALHRYEGGFIHPINWPLLGNIAFTKIGPYLLLSIINDFADEFFLSGNAENPLWNVAIKYGLYGMIIWGIILVIGAALDMKRGVIPLNHRG